MRGKRSKQYRKLLQQYGLSFGFREPYQVLLDADIIKDADKFKMDLIGGLERTLHGKVKPMITQCSIRHLYASASEPGMSYIIDKAKLFERRRCDHRPEEYPEPLSTVECLSSVVDPKSSKTNQHRYVVASQNLDVRKAMREIVGIPLVYINRSVMILEPMAGASIRSRERGEKGKFRAEIKSGRASGSQGMKRKRLDAENNIREGHQSGAAGGGEFSPERKRPYGKGAKGPNPLSVKKSKKRVDGEGAGALSRSSPNLVSNMASTSQDGDGPSETKPKRRRKHKPDVRAGGVSKTEEAGSGGLEG